MGNVNRIFEAFYGNYDYDRIQKAYGTISEQILFENFYKTVPFSVEIRMKNDVFAMQLNTDNVVSIELMTVIGYFFDNYSEERNCVWTKKEKNIKKFFKSGITRFLDFGGKININIAKESMKKIIGLITGKTLEDDVLNKFCDNFKELENKNWNKFAQDITTRIQLEEEEKHIEEVTCMDLPLDWSNIYASNEKTAGIHVESAADGLILSLNNLGRVDIEYISQITGDDYKTVISALKGSIYQNPERWGECFYKGWETADEYLSGNVADKWKKAKKANKIYKGYFEDNVRALEKVIPQSVSTEDIYVTLGSPWVPTDIIDDFIEHLLGPYISSYTNKNDIERYCVKHDEATGVWKVPVKTKYKGDVKSKATYGTKHLEAGYIIERTLNMKSVFVTDEVISTTNKTGKKRTVNKAETIHALDKQKKIIEEFQKWIWTDERRKMRLEEIYEEKYCSNVVRHYDGSFLTFPQMNPDEKLFDYQKNAVARIMFSPNTLLAHDVGAGKTYVMTAAGMEMRRIGISKKNLYVVPNNLVGQWKKVFLQLYPDANLLCVEPGKFTPNKREQVLKNIRDKDYDGIIMAYSCFELVSVSMEYTREKLENQLNEIYENAKDKNKLNDTQKKKVADLKKELSVLDNAIKNKHDTVCFDNLGINTMFVDEAHNFKNLPINTKINKVQGISKSGSEKCKDMLDKVRIIQRANNGRGIVFATGTPITNSLADIYVMQTYLQKGELSLLGLGNFDSWIGMFAEKNTEFEIDVDTNNFRMATRFSKFHNMPELSSLLSMITDFHQVDKSNGIPEIDGYRDIIIPKTSEFKDYLKEIANRADDIRRGRVAKEDDNMLKITTDGRKAALDLRLVDNAKTFTYQSKVAHCADNVFEVYSKTREKKSTQLIFCDTSTPKAGFNMYDELKGLLVGMGIPNNEIAFIHDATIETKRNELFMKAQTGEISILIGSTFKLGLGVNVQDKLVALHHLDVPWRPSDMIQREGRILRKGNENKKVEIFRYITEGSFDAYSWQLLESKQKMIRSILSGCMPERMCAEVDDIVLNYAEVKAIAIGNPLLKKRVETANELSRHLTLQKRLIETRQALEIELVELPGRIINHKKKIENCVKDIAFYDKNKRDYDKNERKIIRSTIFGSLMENELASEESTACSYQGFDIILPTNMAKTRPYVYVQKHGRYYVSVGDVERGVLIRIDNFLEEMDKHLEHLERQLENLYQREVDIKAELEKKESFSDTIEALKKELEKIDKKLGVKKK